MLTTAIGRLKVVGILEAISFLVLLGIAMPLKYAADIHEAVSVVGMAHGVLFVLYLITIVNALAVRQITVMKSVFAFVIAFLPFGPFLFNRKLH